MLRSRYQLGAPSGGEWREVFNSDAGVYGGGNVGSSGAVIAVAEETHGRPFTLDVELPPLAVVAFKK